MIPGFTDRVEEVNGQRIACSVGAEALPGGHFFIDDAPEATAVALMSFLGWLG